MPKVSIFKKLCVCTQFVLTAYYDRYIIVHTLLYIILYTCTCYKVHEKNQVGAYL